MDAAIEQGEQRLQGFDADARKPFGQHVGTQRHRGAHRAHRQRGVDARGVTAQQVELQRGEIRLVDARLGKIAEPGVDAVDRGIAGGLGVDHRPRRGDARARVGRKPDLGAIVGNGEQVGQREM
jgi:hypothetical protein